MRLTTDIVAPPGGVMTDEVGVITGELTLASEVTDSVLKLSVQYRESAEWYAVTGGTAVIGDPNSVHALAAALLNRPTA